MAQKDSILNIVINILKAGSGDKDAKDALSGMGDQLSGIATGILGNVIGFTTLAGAAYALFDELKQDIAVASEAETTVARLGATVQSTGRSSETSTAQIHNMAEGMRGLFSTEDIENATNLLMRFMDIPTVQIPGDLVLIQNMAAGLGETLPAAANTLGMALETGRLRGLGFSREMQNTISTMMTAGDIAGADAIIMDQLNEKFSGQAAAALDTYAGKQAVITSDFDEMKIAVGDYFLPALKALDDEIIKSLAGWEQLGSYLDRTSQAGNTQQLDTLKESLTAITKVYSDLQDKIGNTTPTEQQTFEMAHLRMEIQYDNDAIVQLTGSMVLNNDVSTDTSENALMLARNQRLAAEETQGLTDSLALTADQLKTLQTALVGETGWETMYTNAKTAADKVDKSLSYLGGQIQGLGLEGSQVWEGFLAETGKISPAAIAEFAKIQGVYETVKTMLAAGISTTVVINYIMSVTGSAEAASVASIQAAYATSATAVANTPTTGGEWQWDTTTNKEIWVAYKGAGGSVEPNSYLWNEDQSSRPEVFVSGGGYILTRQDAMAALGGGKGGAATVVNFYITGGDPKEIAREIVTKLNLQGIQVIQ